MERGLNETERDWRGLGASIMLLVIKDGTAQSRRSSLSTKSMTQFVDATDAREGVTTAGWLVSGMVIGLPLGLSMLKTMNNRTTKFNSRERG